MCLVSIRSHIWARDYDDAYHIQFVLFFSLYFNFVRTIKTQLFFNLCPIISIGFWAYMCVSEIKVRKVILALDSRNLYSTWINTFRVIIIQCRYVVVEALRSLDTGILIYTFSVIFCFKAMLVCYLLECLVSMSIVWMQSNENRQREKKDAKTIASNSNQTTKKNSPKKVRVRNTKQANQPKNNNSQRK